MGFMIDTESKNDGVISEPNWKYWISRRIGLFVMMLSYMVLVFAGLLPQLVSIVAGSIATLIDAVIATITKR